MTENEDRRAASDTPGTPEHGGWPASHDEPRTPPHGTPAVGGQPAPNPWSAQAQSGSPPQPGSGYSEARPGSPAQPGPGDPSGPLYGSAVTGHSGQPAGGGFPAGSAGGEHGERAPEGESHGARSEHGEQGSSYPPAGSTTMFPAPPAPNRSRARGGSRVVAGAAVLALLVGGGAGGIAGYLVADNNSGGGSVVNALHQQPTAKQTAAPPEGTVEAVATKVLPSVVQLQVVGRAGAGEGSGFVLSEDGYILTNNHVVESASGGAGQIQAVFQDGKKVPAKIIGRDPTTDIAVVKVDGVGNLKPVELGRSDDLRVGQSVVAIGSPFELAGTVTAGIVSSLHRPVSAGGGQGDQTTVMDAIQTDAAINPGNSGGPLVNMAGQVIGINSAIYSPQSGLPGAQSEGGNVGIGFAIPIDQARRTADDIINTGKAKQTYIGAQVGNSPNGGAVVMAVEPGSPAEQAGLKAGDVITKIDDRPVDGANTLVAAIRTRAPDERVTLTVDGSRTIEVTLGGQDVETR
ncbi:putative serine protease PepD [Amycolatopsis arida]|uniref:Putative serine protease PepD n=1 Tax=Amycolatopsis arida TaxID=587909 RepID=A0A1I5Q8E8_9PSEU|nr:trypsin-like peptidase domain-containing protein [Amycolatopsis arida]TDX98741.1 putative serine protease PepD [Amycolatopsis arida]SFP42136.1 putative serine protease PepD [Amycolatopsis arida]